VIKLHVYVENRKSFWAYVLFLLISCDSLVFLDAESVMMSPILEEGRWEEFLPVSTAMNPIEFEGNHRRLRRSVADLPCVKFKFSEGSGSSLAGDSQMTQVNNFLHSLFSEVEVEYDR